MESSISHFEDISSRHDLSLDLLDLLRTCLSTPDNLTHLKPQFLDKLASHGGTATLRVRIIRLQREEHHHPLINIYRVEIVDLEKKGFLVFKASKQPKLLEDQNYIVDRVKLSINKKGDVVLASCSSTFI